MRKIDNLNIYNLIQNKTQNRNKAIDIKEKLCQNKTRQKG